MGFLWAIVMMVCLNACKTEDKKGSDLGEWLHENSNPGKDARIAFMLDYPVDSGFPRCLEPDGTIRGVKSRDWTSGFYPGILWLVYEETGDEAYRKLAEKWTAMMEQEKANATTHDMGFKINCSFGNGYRLTGDSAYRAVIIESAKTLSSRFNEKTGCIRSWDFNKDIWKFPVIIDNMMNLELLFLATQLSGDSGFYKIANRHALTTLENHFRADNSSFHVVDYDPETGQVLGKQTHQGYADASAWARGQAWGLYGYTMAYRFTKDPRFLEQAQKIYTFIFNHPDLPADLIPYWDYDAPLTDSQPRDVSAATVAASALYELYTYTKNQEMISKADLILKVLSTDKYLAPEKDHLFILTHSTGNKPKSDEVDVPIIYADYYYLEALLRKKGLEEN